MQEDPSVWGVASAFVFVEEEAERAFIGWCSGVGSWYDNPEDGDMNRGNVARRLSRARFSGSASPTVGDEKETEAVSKERDGTRRRESDPGHEFPRTVWRKSATSLSVSAGRPVVAGRPNSTFMNRGKGKERKTKRHEVMNVRELGILPVQRVTRYTLLFRDLLNHTPSSSPSRALVEQALDVAKKVAANCDNAQRNRAFAWKR